MGKAFVHHDIWDESVGAMDALEVDAEAELERLDIALKTVEGELAASAEKAEHKLGRELAEIFEAHLAMLQDRQLLSGIRDAIVEEGISAPRAVRRVFRWWVEAFRGLENPNQRERSDDVADLGRRVLRILSGYEGHSLEAVPHGSVLMARHLLPSDVVFLDPERVVAMVVEEGGPGSHCSLLARGLGIPKVARVGGLLSHVREGEQVLVDGVSGEVLLSPAEETAEAFHEHLSQSRTSAEVLRQAAGKPALTEEGAKVAVMANISGLRDARAALANGADGIGLFRIEAVYLRARHVPEEDELFTELATALEPFQGKPVCVRLLDVGGDKVVPCLKLAAEPHPFLGRRGVRLLLDYPGLLACQLRVLLRLAESHDLRVLIPMVTDLSDVLGVKEALHECARGMESAGTLELGVMIETPAAALFTREICEEVDFVSIGTNDLTQYVMAAARGNPLVSRYYEEKHPAVMRMVEMICRSAAAAGKPVSLCGTLAAWEESIPALIKAGVSLLSVASPLIPSVKEAVRRVGQDSDRRPERLG